MVAAEFTVNVASPTESLTYSFAGLGEEKMFCSMVCLGRVNSISVIDGSFPAPIGLAREANCAFSAVIFSMW